MSSRPPSHGVGIAAGLLVLAVTAACTSTATGGADTAGPSSSGAPTAHQIDSRRIEVEREIDGDSLELRVGDDVVEVRLLGINAPELADCQGPAARAALAGLLAAGDIVMDGRDTDSFGRMLVWLHAGGEDVNEAMVRSGWALAVHGDGDHLEPAMRAAAAEGVGLWGDVEDCEPVDARVEIIDAEPDPPGPDDARMNDEFVVIENVGVEPVDLTGWMLRDESTGNRYTFDPVTIEPGARVTVRTGCGDDDRSTRYWCAGTPVWSNRGETALLLGPDGTHVSHLFF